MSQLEVLMTPAQREEFTRWVQNVSLTILKCRDQQHDFPDWDDHKRNKVRRQRNGSFVIRAACKRKCGVVRNRFVGTDGYLTRSNKLSMDYSQAMPANRDPLKGYLMPDGARTHGGGFTREQRALIRLEIIARLGEWITDEDDDG